MNLPLVPPKRCAVYCRVSSDERLDQSFNSIDAQREAGRAYIHSQRAEGWIPVGDDFEDGGYSGGNMERPALRRLLADIEHGKVDVVVVYKIDRLSRSLSDFARMVEVFDRRGVSFVSVTQQFNTTTSMGWLMLNVLLSFAQFEREVSLVRNYQREVERQKLLVRKAETAQRNLLFIVGALRQLLADENFTNLLRAEGLDTLPQYLADRVWARGSGT